MSLGARSNTPPALRLMDIDVAFSGGQKLRIKDFKVAAGERVLIHGPSGHGKTTVLHLFAGLLVPKSGSVWVGSTDLRTINERQRSLLRRRDFAIIFQTLNLLDHLTALENVLLAGGPTPLHRDQALAALAFLNMDQFAHATTASLSLGQRQRVAAARVPAAKPKVILADEPTSSLDEANANMLMAALWSAAKETTLVMVSHDRRIRDRFPRVVSIDEVLTP